MSTEMPSHQIEVSSLQVRRMKQGLLMLGAFAAVVLIVGLFSRQREASALNKWTENQIEPTVNLITPSNISSAHTVALPGRLEAWEKSSIYSRVNGYVKSWRVDIGANVKAGQLLAEIDTPELDQQYEQAKADLVRVQADEALAISTAQRWHNLLGSDSVSKQEADEKQGAATALKAATLAAKANVDRLAALMSFKRITAPYDGVVIARKVDVGALVSAGDNRGAELFTIADNSKLRLYVNVPQNEATWLKPGIEAEVTVPERPKTIYKAKLVNTSEAVNSASGSVLAQFTTDSAHGELLPGAYASVRIVLPTNPGVTRIPASALMLKPGGTKVAVLNAQNKVELRDVHIALDLGETLDIDSGLNPQDRVIDSPPDSLMQGDKVKLAQAKEPKKAAAHD